MNAGVTCVWKADLRREIVHVCVKVGLDVAVGGAGFHRQEPPLNVRVRRVAPKLQPLQQTQGGDEPNPLELAWTYLDSDVDVGVGVDVYETYTHTCTTL